jgi:hypothetical protein
MTEGEALQIGRQAVEDARKRVGVDKNALERELEAKAGTDPELMTAFALAGHLILRSQQDQKH